MREIICFARQRGDQRLGKMARGALQRNAGRVFKQKGFSGKHHAKGSKNEERNLQKVSTMNLEHQKEKGKKPSRPAEEKLFK